MPAVKTEDIHVSTVDYTRGGHTQQRQHVSQHQRPTVPTDPVLAIAQASHEALLASGNVVYRAAFQEINDLRAAITRWQLQNVELSIQHEAARDAYMRLHGQMKAHVCDYSSNHPLLSSSGRAQNPNPSRSSAPHNPAFYHIIRAPLPSLQSQVSVSSQASRDPVRLPLVPASSNTAVSQVSLSSQASPPMHASASSSLSRVSAVSSQDSVPPHVPHLSQVSISNPSQVSENPPVPLPVSVTPEDAGSSRNDVHLPTGKSGNSSTINHCGPNSVSPAELHSVHPTKELFWYRSDWVRKGRPTNAFLTDEDGNPLGHMIKDIRAAARMIWTNMAERLGSDIAPSFKRNRGSFQLEFIARIEEMRPCLKLCHNHWKAWQIASSSYNYWYKQVWKGEMKRF